MKQAQQGALENINITRVELGNGLISLMDKQQSRHFNMSGAIKGEIGSIVTNQQIEGFIV